LSTGSKPMNASARPRNPPEYLTDSKKFHVEIF
jgi:hypothetical protein